MKATILLLAVIGQQPGQLICPPGQQCYAVPTQAIPQPTEIPLDDRLGVFLIQTYSSTNTDSSYGTCFLLNTGPGPGYIVTNYHAVRGCKPTAKITSTKAPYQAEFSAHLIGTNENYDLALLVSYDMPQARYIPVTLARQSPPMGTRIEISGYPMSYSWPAGRWPGVNGGQDQKIRAWYALTCSSRDNSGNVLCSSAKSVYHGNSGSPGFYQKQVVLVVWAGKPSGGGVGTPVESVCSFLRDAAVSLPRHPNLRNLFAN